ncbi:zf-TFIIB domain-containing protein [Candidatus Woesearchaeota archaeon]|nr:zf-TFIIB domain-containing protein [Candidatus Woesearchaeota archaeon]
MQHQTTNCPGCKQTFTSFRFAGLHAVRCHYCRAVVKL